MPTFMKMKIETLVSGGLVEELTLPPHEMLVTKGDIERWFRDKESKIVYRLKEHYGLNDANDIRWEVVPPGELNWKTQ